MKMKKVLTILTVLLATTLSCKKEKEVNCDCDAEVISTYSGPQNQPLMSLQHLCTGEVKDSITKTNTNWTVGEVTCIDLW